MSAPSTGAPLGVGVAGCGNIAEPYLRDLVTHPEIAVVGMTDLDSSRAETLAAKYGGQVYPDLNAMLVDDRVALVVNLTVHHAHYEVSRQCLEADKHVHSEKPLALAAAQAQELVALAERKNLRLGCSPFTFMGEAQQTARQWISQGKLGTVRVAYADVNWGRIETWHPAPEPFYEVGALFDVGVYPLTILTAVFGPARKVWAYGDVLQPERVTKQGTPFRVGTPDFVVAMIELESGPLVRLTTNFYVPQQGKQMGIEFHGDLGSLYLSSWFMFNADVAYAPFGQEYEAVPLVKTPYPGVQWGRGVVDMATAIVDGRAHQATGSQAAHVVEILEAAAASLQCGGPMRISSSFTPPAPLGWAL